MKFRVLEFVAGSLFAFACVAVAFAAPDDWAEGAVGSNDGANRDFYNRRAALRWRNPEGDWRDADGVRQGDNCKMNTPGKDGKEGKRDGILRAWIDGRPAFEKTDIRFRDVGKLKIEQVWMNVYHGGTKKSPYDQHLYIDNVVVAKKYIGPMSLQDAE